MTKRSVLLLSKKRQELESRMIIVFVVIPKRKLSDLKNGSTNKGLWSMFVRS